jgi:hypothetical protein
VEQLVGDEQHRLQGKLAATHLEKILKARSQQFHDEDSAVSAAAVLKNFREADSATQVVVELILHVQEGPLGNHLNLDGHFFVRVQLTILYNFFFFVSGKLKCFFYRKTFQSNLLSAIASKARAHLSGGPHYSPQQDFQDTLIFEGMANI